MNTLFMKRILEDGEVKIPLDGFNNLEYDIDDLSKYSLFDICDYNLEEEFWISLHYFKELNVAFKFELVIQLGEMQIAYLSNDIFPLQEYITKYIPIVQNEITNYNLQAIQKKIETINN